MFRYLVYIIPPQHWAMFKQELSVLVRKYGGKPFNDIQTPLEDGDEIDFQRFPQEDRPQDGGSG